MTTLCECMDISASCKSVYIRASRTEQPPRAGELMGEAALALAVPLALAAAVSFALPFAGIVVP